MKPGPELADRLRAEASRLEVGAPPFARVAKRGRRRSRLRTGAIALSLVALSTASIGLGLVTSRDEPPRRQATSGGPGRELRAQEEAFENNERIFENAQDPVPRPAGSTTTAGQEEYAELASGDDLQSQEGSPGSGEQTTTTAGSRVGEPGPVGGSLAAPRVIKTARLRIEVGEGSLSATFADVERLAGRHAGFVSESFTSSDPARSGELTIRVPAAVFESVVAELKSLGRVETQRISGVDVTADFVDLQARLRNWEAQERVLVRLMGEANTINESLQVQRELQGVRVEIERIQGQLRVLGDQTELASISMSIHEPGAAEALTEPEEKGAWERAVSAAGEVLTAMLVGLGYLLPILGALLILWFVTRAIRSRRPE
jgi:Domain of unknown function (DUF4349)